MSKLEVEVPLLGIEPNTVLIDGGRMLHKINWPTDGLVKDLVKEKEKYIRKIIPKSDLFLILITI